MPTGRPFYIATKRERATEGNEVVVDISDRMKNYEQVSRMRLTRHVPVILRLDGKAFHTLTRNMDRPYDSHFHRSMWHAAHALCAEVQGCQMAYVQSDEISLLVTDWRSMDSSAWFDNQVQKMVSVAASVCAVQFTSAITRGLMDWCVRNPGIFYNVAFDARAFSVPVHDVCNYFVWRQQDATRNSLNMLAQSKFSHSELLGKSNSEVQDMLMLKMGINWNDLPTNQKRGVCIVKDDEGWQADLEIPIFTKDRQYIERHVATPEWMK